jgi:glyoxylase-like metal-dependent hydrolase (beta-lactamase superfamily II)
MNILSGGISFLDLKFLGHPGVIATGVLHGRSGLALIDPGPSTTVATLRLELASAGLSVRDVTAILLTHIHLDHAGVSGTLVRENPHIRVYVHERGAPHMADPAKLLASAARLYGGDMERLWGEVLPVPSSAIEPLAGSERFEAGGVWLEVAYTPGHASHHVSYFNAGSGIAFVGDTAGIKLAPNGYVLPPTPPPDIDLELWDRSLDTIDAWKPDALFLTHFGPFRPHLDELRGNLRWIADLAKSVLARDESADGREERFVTELRAALAHRLDDAEMEAYEAAGRFDLSWRGLARYWSKRS